MARPFRFTFILVLAALATALAAVGGWRFARASAPVNGPIILISIDALRADHLSAYGYRKLKTPTIDALAADGTLFERAYSHAPLTLPAHAAILSGRLPFETGVRDNVGFVLKSGERMLPEMLRERGYVTGGVVSTSLLRKETGVAQGFDFYDADLPERSPDSSFERVRRDGNDSETIAENWLGEQRSARIFLFLHLYEPSQVAGSPQDGDPDSYDQAVARADAVVGNLVQYLKSHQLYDRSTILLVSDHGEGLGDHGEQGHGLLLHDEVLHVPLIVKQPGGVGAGRRVADVVQQIDLVPTILDLAKAPIPASLRGRSLKPLFEESGELPDRFVYSESLYARYHFGWSGQAALTGKRYRYVSKQIEEIYDLAHDPGERRNVAETERPATATLRRALDEMRPRVPAVAADDPIDPKTKIGVVERYRKAVALGSDRQWPQALTLLQHLANDEPALIEIWRQLALFAYRIDRFDVALDAYDRMARLDPTDATPLLGAAATLVKQRRFEEAREQARRAADEAEGAPQVEVEHAAAAHELLARIALARHDADGARSEADLARRFDPQMPLPAYVEGRLLYDQSEYQPALALFEVALDDLRKTGRNSPADLHFYAGDTLLKLERYSEAEAEFAAELEEFPQHIRARAGLALVYQRTGRTDEAERALTELTAIAPTPDSFALAARLWAGLGDHRQADAVRAESRRLFSRGH